MYGRFSLSQPVEAITETFKLTEVPNPEKVQHRLDATSTHCSTTGADPVTAATALGGDPRLGQGPGDRCQAEER